MIGSFPTHIIQIIVRMCFPLHPQEEKTLLIRETELGLESGMMVAAATAASVKQESGIIAGKVIMSLLFAFYLSGYFSHF